MDFMAGVSLVQHSIRPPVEVQPQPAGKFRCLALILKGGGEKRERAKERKEEEGDDTPSRCQTGIGHEWEKRSRPHRTNHYFFFLRRWRGKRRGEGREEEGEKEEKRGKGPLFLQGRGKRKGKKGGGEKGNGKRCWRCMQRIVSRRTVSSVSP